MTRRSLLQAGTISLLGLSMDQLTALQAEDSGRVRKQKAKSVIYIFLSGGLSQIDSFDMKPEAPEEIRGEFKGIATKTTGLRICEHLPSLAKCSDKWALCRSITHNSNEHSQGHHMMLTGKSDLPLGFDPNKPKESDWPSIAALAAHQLTPNGNLPASMVLPEKLMHRTGRVIPGQFAGMLGRKNEPFYVETSKYNAATYGAFPDYLFHHADGKVDGSKKRFLAPNFTLPQGVGMNRLKHRLALMDQLNAQVAHLEETAQAGSMNRFQDLAVKLLSDPKTKQAFEVHNADPKLLDRYGQNLFGWSLLLARQLVETGVNLVQVNLGNNEAWDTHQAAFPNLKNFLFPPMDQAVAALIGDLADRGMLEDTLVVMASEFGRTPKIFKIPNAPLPGRDHWGSVQTALFAGGGIQGGAIVGETDKLGGHPIADPHTPEDFAATIYQALGIPEGAVWHDLSGRPHFIYHGQPIAELFG
jgi:hypothetical protein